MYDRNQYYPTHDPIATYLHVGSRLLLAPSINLRLFRRPARWFLKDDWITVLMFRGYDMCRDRFRRRR